ncbi:hypothetical protein T03_15606, partial [Trichinella britovi]
LIPLVTEAMKIQTRNAKQAMPKSGLSGVIFAGRVSFCPRMRSIFVELLANAYRKTYFMLILLHRIFNATTMIK